MAGLFSEIIIRSTTIRNRIIMPAMVTFDFGTEEGIVNDGHVKHYEDKAKAGNGIIITEALCVKSNGLLSAKQLRIWSDEYTAGLSRIALACRKHGAVILAQIHHAGLRAVNNGGGIVSSSDYQKNAGTEKAVSARALTAEEIHGLQRDFISAAMRAKQAGFNGVELHCAHGYIGSQFFSPMINKREDAYGGNIINRARFASEIISGIRKAAGDDFIISCRTGCNDPDLSGSIGIAKELEKSGVDMLNVSFGMVTPFDMKHETPPQVPDGFDYNWIVYGGTQVKKNVGIPTAVVFDIKTPVQAAYLVENGLADFTAILRGQLVDDNWVEKARTGKEVIPCLNCRICRWYVSGSRCPGRKKVQAL